MAGSVLLCGGAKDIAWAIKCDEFTLKAGDYQDDYRFRDTVSDVLQQLLWAGAGGDVPASGDYQLRGFVYCVTKDGGVVTQNDEQIQSDIEKGAGDGYQFRLHYADGKVRLWKHEAEVDLYRTAYYWGTDGDEWYLPGYRDVDTWTFLRDSIYTSGYEETTVTEDGDWVYTSNTSSETPMPEEDGAIRRSDVDGVEVFLAVPAGTIRRDSTLGQIEYQIHDQVRKNYQSIAAVSVGAVLLLLLAWKGRSALLEAIRGLRRWIRGLWLEWKLTALLASGAWLAVCGWRYLGSTVITVAAAAIFALCVLDLREDKEDLWANSFVRWLERQELPLQKKLLKRGALDLAGGLILAAGAAVCDLFLLFWIGYRGIIILTLVPISIGILGIFLLVRLFAAWREQKALAANLGKLQSGVEAMAAGHYDADWTALADSDLRGMAAGLSRVQDGIQTAVEERTRSERMKIELVANVSHDLKTPLTSILSYADLLAREEDLPDHVRDYVTILNAKAQRLKTMVQEVFEVSKAASGDLELHWEELDLGKLLRQTLADQQEAIDASGLRFKTTIPVDPVPVRGDGDRLYRVFQNLIQNVLRYALEDSRVYLTLEVEGDTARVLVQNISKEELPRDKDFTARFVRGDESRTDGGSGLGLAIAKSFTEACGGQLQVRTDADLFTAEVRLSVSPSDAKT
ncbi:HAMP domain-containing sensor histidine kinase [Pseudoflavonifractor sp. MSJ-37]|uniref:sensor histidine kinase n=1 Tax=Pseudoflavonifractor sp. MSJ-37 TaxID=2841531 RepID=UPI001C115DFE|nr:HAMP domain-containing sensor histidine kinase [Pseudoflavonifractor sp. MSJ-37]MBU5434718.1 HAMP domain-containing histidine kinase [Pseudoflavonifractor sp. MSJ-37]